MLKLFLRGRSAAVLKVMLEHQRNDWVKVNSASLLVKAHTLPELGHSEKGEDFGHIVQTSANHSLP